MNEETLAGLYKLRDIILEWNEKINVTAIRDPEEFMQKNIIDSLTLLGRPELESAGYVLDMGTGGGFPGLPLAVCCPDKQFVLTDSVGKKLKVVQAAADELGLSNVKVVHSRAEDMAKLSEYREQFDLVVSRAVADMSVLCEYCLPFVKKGGYFTAYKTENSKDEIDAAAKAVRVLGGSKVHIFPADFLEICERLNIKPGGSSNPDGIQNAEFSAASGISGHVFAVVKKEGRTPSNYPRKAGEPVKKPIR